MSGPAERRGPFVRGNLLVWLLGTVAATFVFGYLLVALLFFPGFGRSTIVTVPDLRGKQARVAASLAERAGLKLVRGQALSSPRLPRGAVLVQSPLAGQEVTRGEEVRVVISSGPERRAIPSVRGLPLREARALLVRHGFTVLSREVRNDAPEGTILGIDPASGTQAVVPSPVTLFLSSGPPRMPVPSVLALPLPEAQTRLQAAGLRLGAVSYDSASVEPLGGIVRQRPAAGDSLPRGRGVSVTVSGRDPTPPPPPDSVAIVDSAGVPATARQANPPTPAQGQ